MFLIQAADEPMRSAVPMPAANPVSYAKPAVPPAADDGEGALAGEAVEFAFDTRRYKTAVGLFIVCVLMGVGFVVGAFMSSGDPKKRDLDRTLKPVLLGMGGLFVLGSIYTLWAGSRGRGVRVRVFPDGLERIDGASVQRCRWGDIRELIATEAFGAAK